MRVEPEFVIVDSVRFVVDMDRDEDGRISGRVHADGEASMPYSGWLELLRLLEDRAAHITERAGPAPLSGDHREVEG